MLDVSLMCNTIKLNIRARNLAYGPFSSCFKYSISCSRNITNILNVQAGVKSATGSGVVQANKAVGKPTLTYSTAPQPVTLLFPAIDLFLKNREPSEASSIKYLVPSARIQNVYLQPGTQGEIVTFCLILKCTT